MQENFKVGNRIKCTESLDRKFLKGKWYKIQSISRNQCYFTIDEISAGLGGPNGFKSVYFDCNNVLEYNPEEIKTSNVSLNRQVIYCGDKYELVTEFNYNRKPMCLLFSKTGDKCVTDKVNIEYIDTLLFKVKESNNIFIIDVILNNTYLMYFFTDELKNIRSLTLCIEEKNEIADVILSNFKSGTNFNSFIDKVKSSFIHNKRIEVIVSSTF